MENKYWQSFGEMNRSDEFKKSLENEFNENLLPLEDVSEILDAKTPRRDFLKYIGFRGFMNKSFISICTC